MTSSVTLGASLTSSASWVIEAVIIITLLLILSTFLKLFLFLEAHGIFTIKEVIVCRLSDSSTPLMLIVINWLWLGLPLLLLLLWGLKGKVTPALSLFLRFVFATLGLIVAKSLIHSLIIFSRLIKEAGLIKRHGKINFHRLLRAILNNFALPLSFFGKIGLIIYPQFRYKTSFE